MGTADLPRIGFLLGIHRRSGTNYLYRLLLEHPDCDGIGAIGEDFLVHNLDSLERYVQDVKAYWNAEWRDTTVGAGGDALRHCLGEGIVRLLRDQAAHHRSTGRAEPPSPSPTEARERLVVSKTPSVEGVSQALDFFPTASMILLVRDGRAVVESGMRSFGWDFEQAVRTWVSGARRILAVRDGGLDPERIMIVKYEDLVPPRQETLGPVLDFLGLARERYDFGRAAALGIIGSSDLAASGEVHWHDVPKPEGFDPLKRYANWSADRHHRFNWIAGREMARLGYELETTGIPGGLQKLGHRCRDVGWTIRVLVPVIWVFLKKIPEKLRGVLLTENSQEDGCE